MTWQMPDGKPSIWVGKFENGNCTKGKLNGRQIDAQDMKGAGDGAQSSF